ncbi:HIT-like domain-containing protein [Russula vinacea]|nr:HIT-like domain-containing protein [Russula vinacea]
MSASTPSAIISAIRPAFDKGKESGDLLFFPSQTHTHKDLSIDFEIRLCPALLEKPEMPTTHIDGREKAKKEKRGDVFEPPYNPNLYVGELQDEEEGAEYVVLLNKYSVVEEHFLLVTKEFQSQTSPLRPSDLLQAYLLLHAARAAGKHLFAFYNCGDLSGASQPHKHLQFFPTDNEDGPPVERLARAARIDKDDKPFSLSAFPFANHVRRLALHASAPRRRRAPSSSHAHDGVPRAPRAMHLDRAAHSGLPRGPPSYNVVLTLGHMYVFPRLRETHVLAASREPLGVNALGFAGLLLVKSADELEAVRSEGPGNVLRGVGCESVHEMQVVGGPELDGDVGSA